jgi:hypothetical protein
VIDDDPAGVGFEEEIDNADHTLAGIIGGKERHFDLYLAGMEMGFDFGTKPIDQRKDVVRLDGGLEAVALENPVGHGITVGEVGIEQFGGEDGVQGVTQISSGG